MHSIFLSITLAFGVSLAHADPSSGDFTKKVNEKFPATTGAKIEPAFPGFWSVIKGGEVLFIRDDMSILIPGDVVDLRTNQSLAASLRAANKPRIPPQDLDAKDAIKFGKGSRKVYVFSDPDCQYCKQLEPELAKLQNAEVFVFMFPLVALHPNSRVVAESIWCQKDRATAWRRYVLDDVAPQSATCDNPISRNLALGERLKVLGTPALVFADGTVVPGAIGVDRIEAQLAATSK